MSSDTVTRAEGIDREVRDRPERCTECDGDLREDEGETYCTECGCVVDEYWIDHGPEWHQYDAAERQRTGLPVTEARHDRGLFTEIGRNFDANGTPLSAGQRRKFHRLRREHSRSRFDSKAERNLAHGFGDIKRVVAALDLPYEVQDRACAIYREAQVENLLLGRSVESMATASIYAACRCLGLPRTVDEIGEFAHVDVDRVKMAFRVLNRELALPTKLVRPELYVPQLASATEAEDVVRFRAIELARCAETSGVATGRNPAGVAAACLYGAAVDTGYQVTPQGTLTQQVIADLAGVTTATIRSNWKELKAHCDC